MTASDADLVDEFRGGDREAFAELYDRYADRIHTFAHTRLRDPEASAAALDETFVGASRELDELEDPARFRPWLFALAGRVISRHLDEQISFAFSGDPAALEIVESAPDIVETDDPVGLVWAAARGLRDRDLELLELHLREGLDGDDLAEVVGVSPAHLEVMTGRLKRRIEIAVGSLLVVRDGSGDCTNLDYLLGVWDRRDTVAFRAQVSRHIESCDFCRETRRAEIDWNSVAPELPMAPAPETARIVVLGAIEVPESTDAPPGREGRISARLPSLHRTRTRRGVGSIPRPAIFAAGSIVVLVVALLVVLSGGGDGPVDTDVAGVVETPTTATAPPTTTVPPSTTTVPPTTTTLDPVLSILARLPDFDLVEIGRG